jgi:hypothetical protein
MNMEHWWNDNERGKPKYSEKKTFPNTTLSTTNPTWSGLGSNLGLHPMSAHNHMNHDMTTFGVAKLITLKIMTF